MIYRTTAILNQPKIKADKTANLSFSTLTEILKGEFDEFNDVYFNKERVNIIIATEDDYPQILRAEAQRLVDEANVNSDV